jgi:hypothetical protein
LFSVKEFDVKIKKNKKSKNYILYRDTNNKQDVKSQINRIIDSKLNWNWEKYGIPHIFNSNGEVYYLHPVSNLEIEKEFFKYGLRGQKYLFSVNKELFSFYYSKNAFITLRNFDSEFYEDVKSIFKKKKYEKLIYTFAVDYTKENIISKKVHLNANYMDKSDIKLIEEISGQKIDDLKEKFNIRRKLDLVAFNKEKEFAFYFK